MNEPITTAPPRERPIPPSDTEMLDWIEAKGASGLPWIARDSETGRGYRLHQIKGEWSPSKTPRAAMAAAMQREKEGAA